VAYNVFPSETGPYIWIMPTDVNVSLKVKTEVNGILFYTRADRVVVGKPRDATVNFDLHRQFL